MPDLKVRATRLGYFGQGADGKRRYPGDEFTLEHERQFSFKWMEPVGWTPKKNGSEDESQEAPKVEASEPEKPRTQKRRGRPPKRKSEG